MVVGLSVQTHNPINSSMSLSGHLKRSTSGISEISCSQKHEVTGTFHNENLISSSLSPTGQCDKCEVNSLQVVFTSIGIEFIYLSYVYSQVLRLICSLGNYMHQLQHVCINTTVFLLLLTQLVPTCCYLKLGIMSRYQSKAER